jgi:hypothetical protein
VERILVPKTLGRDHAEAICVPRYYKSGSACRMGFRLMSCKPAGCELRCRQVGAPVTNLLVIVCAHRRCTNTNPTPTNPHPNASSNHPLLACLPFSALSHVPRQFKDPLETSLDRQLRLSSKLAVCFNLTNTNHPLPITQQLPSSFG